MKLLHKYLRSFSRDRTGAASVEFVMIAPLYFAFVFSMFEAGWLMTKSMMLERGLDMTVRELRFGSAASLNTNEFKKVICSHSKIIRDCEDSMTLNQVLVKSASDIPDKAECVDRTAPAKPAKKLVPGDEDEFMYVSACVFVNPIFPFLGLGLHLPKDELGGMALIAYSAYVTEPSG